VISQLNRVWRQNLLSLATKLRIYTTCVLAVRLYGAETWTLLIKGRLTKAAGIPHDMSKAYPRH